MFDEQIINMLLEGIRDTLYMTIVSTFLGYLFGLPMGILLTVTGKDGLKPNNFIYRIFDVVANIVRSIPFLILLILLIPFTRFVVGKSYGPTAVIVPLVVAAAPYIARMVESSLNEVDAGVIEAARSMGASNFDIIFKVNQKPFGAFKICFISFTYSFLFSSTLLMYFITTGSLLDSYFFVQMLL